MPTNEHYFTEEPTSPSEPHELVVQVRKRTLTLTSDRGVFSHAEADKGTLLLAARVQFGEARRILDLGCGYGLLGIDQAKVNEDGTLTSGRKKGTIHRLGAMLQGTPACNGWTSWQYTDPESGELRFIDELRQRVREGSGEGSQSDSPD